MRLHHLAAGLLLAACGCAGQQVMETLPPAEANVRIVTSNATVTQILHKLCEKKVDVDPYVDGDQIRKAAVKAGGNVAQVVNRGFSRLAGMDILLYDTVLWKCPEGLLRKESLDRPQHSGSTRESKPVCSL